MTDHDDHVPPGVLDELSAAFRDPADQGNQGNQGDQRDQEDPGDPVDHLAPTDPTDPTPPPGPVYDLDDPNIDALLGITDAPPAAAEVTPAPVDPLLAAAASAAPDAHAVPATHAAPAADAPRRTIVIEETDLPDAVYLDEEAEERLRTVHGHSAEASATAPTIVIGDADDGRQVEPAPSAPRPPIDPRVRARRIAVGRAKGRRRLVVLSLVLGALAVVIAGLAVLGSSWFSVERIDIQGSSYSRADVERIVASTRGKPVLLVDTVDLEHRLEALAWVESATVDTDFPHGLFVDVRERLPVAYFLGSDGKARAIDRDARVLAVLNGIPTQYPQITGTAPDTAAGHNAGAVFQGAATVILSLPPELSEQMKSVGVDSSAGTVSMKLRTGATVRLGTPTDLTRKLARLLLVVRQGDFKKLKLIDVSAADVSTK